VECQKNIRHFVPLFSTYRLLILVQDISILRHLKQISNHSYPILLYLFRAIYCSPSSKRIFFTVYENKDDFSFVEQLQGMKS